MKRINNEQILDTLYDLADAAGMRIDEFIAKLEDDYGERLPDLENIPEEIANELIEARETKKRARKETRNKQAESDTEKEIARFRELFPDVKPEDIPESVWEEVRGGATLSHAYALYTVTQDSLTRHANDVNERNSKRGAAADSQGSTEPVFTKELVEKMSGKDIKNNYKGILNAMKNWRF